jgi:hypothetical protein
MAGANSRPLTGSLYPAEEAHDFLSAALFHNALTRLRGLKDSLNK